MQTSLIEPTGSVGSALAQVASQAHIPFRPKGVALIGLAPIRPATYHPKKTTTGT